MNEPKSFPVTVGFLVLGTGILVSGWLSYRLLLLLISIGTPIAVELTKSGVWYAGALNAGIIIATIILPTVPMALFLAWFIDWINR